jgi:hypothetical protein
VPEPTVAPPSTARVPLTGVIAGTVCSVVLFALARSVTVAEIDAGRYPKMLVSVLIFALAGFVVGRAVKRSGQSSTRSAGVGFGAALIGLAIGTVLWTSLERFLPGDLHIDPGDQRPTLLPIEIALLWTFGALPILAGIFAGMSGRSAKLTTNN